MANTIKTYVSDGVRTSYPVDFTLGYLNDRSFVYVYQGDDPTIQLSYTWTDDENINLDAPVPSGEEFNIRRIVPRTRLINDYVDGAQIRERNLDQSYSQALMIIEEIEDGYIIDQPDWVIKQNLDMLGYSIINATSIQAETIIDASGKDWYAVVAQAVIDAQAAQAGAEVAQTGAQAAQAGAEVAQAAAEAAEAATAALYSDFNDRYYGPVASDPANAPSGAASTEGDLYFNTTNLIMKVYNGTVWQPLAVAAAVDVTYDNTTSGLTATDAQAAIDEVEARVDLLESDTHTHTNKSILDNTTASYTTAEKTKLAGVGAERKNILINPNPSDPVRGVNQRAFDGNWSALAVGDYGWDRWRKVSDTVMEQPIVPGEYKPSTTYTLSGTGISTQQLVSPASGNWNIKVPVEATDLQLEKGEIATPQEFVPKLEQQERCLPYYEVVDADYKFDGSLGAAAVSVSYMWFFTRKKRITPANSILVSSLTEARSVSLTAKSLNGVSALWEWTGDSFRSRSVAMIIAADAEVHV